MPQIFEIVFCLCLLEVSVRDIKTYEISDKTLCVLAATGLLYSQQVTEVLLSSLLGGLLLAAVYGLSRGGLGLGDIKLILAAGVWLNWRETLLALLLAFWLGGLFAAHLLLVKRWPRRAQLPFAPFLAAGTAASFFFGRELLAFYEGAFFP